MPLNPLPWAQNPQLLSRRVWLVPLAASVNLFAIFSINLLVFHVLSELFTVFLALIVFFLIWGTHRFGCSNYLLFVTAGYFWIAALDLFHTLFYPGMRIFDALGETGNRSIQSWVTARFLEATILLVAAFIHKVHFSRLILMIILAALALGSHALVLLGWFPDAFRIGQELSSLKIMAEYAIIAILMFAMAATYLRRSHFSSPI